MKHDNVCMYNAFLWNWLKSIVCDDSSPIHLTSMMQLGMKLNGPKYRSGLNWALP
jgi:hypothetical protein